MSNTELRVWSILQGRQLGGFKFSRQHPIGDYFVDFACLSARLVIEVDGPGHDEYADRHDSRRDAYVESQGFKVLRIGVRDVDEDEEAVWRTIYAALGLEE